MHSLLTATIQTGIDDMKATLREAPAACKAFIVFLCMSSLWYAVDAADRRPRYDSATQAYRKILYEEGMRGGLYRGYFPNLIRNSIISATELVYCTLSILFSVSVKMGKELLCLRVHPVLRSCQQEQTTKPELRLFFAGFLRHGQAYAA